MYLTTHSTDHTVQTTHSTDHTQYRPHTVQTTHSTYKSHMTKWKLGTDLGHRAEADNLLVVTIHTKEKSSCLWSQ